MAIWGRPFAVVSSNLGQFSGGATYIDLVLNETMSSAQGFGYTYAFAANGFSSAVPEPSTWAIVNRGARDERSSAIRRLQAIMPRHQATPIRRAPGCLWARGGGRLGTLGTNEDVEVFNEFAMMVELGFFVLTGKR
jgi:hypothetical protein